MVYEFINNNPFKNYIFKHFLTAHKKKIVFQFKTVLNNTTEKKIL